ncbi:MAG: FIST N-terminal domain-containing protein [Patescibacteria group bacterium]
MIQAGVGISKGADAYQAAYTAAKTAMERAGTGVNFLFVFASPALHPEDVVRGVKEAAGAVPFIGCSTAGEISNEGPSQKSIGVMAIRSDTLSFYTGIGRDIAADARTAGRSVAREVLGKAAATSSARSALRAFVMLPDVLAGNGADIVRGVADVLGAHFPIVGGAAGDDFMFEKTYEYHNDGVVSGAVMGVGLAGTATIGIGVRHGWVPIGMPMKVTRAEGAVLHELDGKPAISIYEDYFGAKAEELRKEALARLAITYPLGLKIPEYPEEYLIRDPITVNKDGSITCAAEIPEGSEVRLMIGSKEKAIDAAQDAARHLMKDFEIAKTKPSFLLIFNCIAREKLFAQKAGDEIHAIMEIVGHDVPMLGFYTYGEQAPLGGEVRNMEKCDPRFYNETVVLFAVGE